LHIFASGAFDFFGLEEVTVITENRTFFNLFADIGEKLIPWKHGFSPSLSESRPKTLETEQLNEIAKSYTNFILTSRSEKVLDQSFPITRLTLPSDPDLATLGGSIQSSGERWNLLISKPNYKFRVPLTVQLESLGKLGLREREDFRENLVETIVRCSNRPAFNRLRSGLIYSLQFASIERFPNGNRDLFFKYLENAVFWTAFYSDSDAAFQRVDADDFLKLWLENQSHWPDFWLGLKDFSEKILENEIALKYNVYNTINFISLFLVMPGQKIQKMIPEVKRWIENLLEFTYLRDKRKHNWRRDLKVPDPLETGLSNVLAWALQSRQEAVASHMIKLIRRMQWEDLELNPYVRFIN
jgi:hypothetical protein